MIRTSRFWFSRSMDGGATPSETSATSRRRSGAPLRGNSGTAARSAAVSTVSRAKRTRMSYSRSPSVKRVGTDPPTAVRTVRPTSPTSSPRSAARRRSTATRTSGLMSSYELSTPTRPSMPSSRAAMSRPIWRRTARSSPKTLTSMSSVPDDVRRPRIRGGRIRISALASSGSEASFSSARTIHSAALIPRRSRGSSSMLSMIRVGSNTAPRPQMKPPAVAKTCTTLGRPVTTSSATRLARLVTSSGVSGGIVK